MGKQDLAKRLIQKFQIQAGTDLSDLAAAIQAQDVTRVRMVAHRLKGAAANVSAEAVRETATQLENLGREGTLAPALELLARLRVQLEAVKDPTN